MSLPQPSTSVKLGHDVGDLLELVEEHDDHVEKLEKCLCKYMRGGKLAAKRPMIRLGGWKWLPIGGVKVDAISYHTEEAERLEALIEERRKTLDTRAPTSYGELRRRQSTYLLARADLEISKVLLPSPRYHRRTRTLLGSTIITASSQRCSKAPKSSLLLAQKIS